FNMTGTPVAEYSFQSKEIELGIADAGYTSDSIWILGSSKSNAQFDNKNLTRNSTQIAFLAHFHLDNLTWDTSYSLEGSDDVLGEALLINGSGKDTQMYVMGRYWSTMNISDTMLSGGGIYVAKMEQINGKWQWFSVCNGDMIRDDPR